MQSNPRLSLQGAWWTHRVLESRERALRRYFRSRDVSKLNCAVSVSELEVAVGRRRQTYDEQDYMMCYDSILDRLG